MNNKTLGIIAIVFGSLVLYSEQEYAWIISAIFIGIGKLLILLLIQQTLSVAMGIFS